ncbi:hypothetical protein K438DRAFT_1866642 [Mycena galopus ATCC 62051]|nr:hypothetical protein K438DRAFT_1866642 [Mycena galopus ATCC 62051]
MLDGGDARACSSPCVRSGHAITQILAVCQVQVKSFPFPPPSFSLLFPDHKVLSATRPRLCLSSRISISWIPQLGSLIHLTLLRPSRPTLSPPQDRNSGANPFKRKERSRCSSSLSLIPVTQGLSNVARIELIFKLSQYYPRTSFLAPFSSAFSSASNHDSLPSKYRQAAPQSSVPFPYCSPARRSIGWPNSPERCQGLPLQSCWPTQLFFHGNLVW